MRVKHLVIKKSILITVALLSILWMSALLRTYSPGRDYVYSKHGGLLFILIVSLMLLSWMLRRKVKIKKGALHVFVWLSMLWFLFAISTFLNIFHLPPTSIAGLFNNLTIQIFIFLFALAWVSMDRHFDIQSASIKMAWFFGIFALVAALAAVQLLFTKQALFGPLAITVTEPRWPQLYGWFASPNYLVDSVAMGVMTAFFLYTSHRANNFFSIFFLLSMLLFLVATGSRGGILGCFAALLWQFALVIKMQPGLRTKLRQIGRYLLIGFLAAIAGVSALLVYVSFMGQNIKWFLLDVLRLRPKSLSTGTGRLDIWRDGLDVFSSGGVSHIFFGHGNNYYAEFHGHSLHNTYLQVLIDHGLLTLIAFLLFITWFFWMSYMLARRVRQRPDALHAVAFLSAPAAYVVVRAVFQGPVFLSGNISWAFTIISGVIMCTAYYCGICLNERK
jgi:hypothetical protein